MELPGNKDLDMSHRIIASEYESAYEAYKAAKYHQTRVEEIVCIECSDEEREEIIAACDEDREDEVDAGEEYEMWGTSHCQAGSWEWRIHLVRA